MARWRPARRCTTTLTVLAAVGVALAPAIGSLALGSPASAAPAAATDAEAATASSQWLARQLTEGAFASPFNPDLPDLGLTTDAVFAMYASGDGALAAPIIDRLDKAGSDDVKTFITLYPWGSDAAQGAADRVGGATAKMLVTAEVAGRDPRSFGGYDLVKETQDVLTPDGPEKGRVQDLGPNTSSNNSNTFGQALAVIGLAGVRSNDASAIEMLLRQQCSGGYFRIFYSTGSAGPESCDAGTASGASEPDRDSTGIAISALVAARSAGAPGLDTPIAHAAAWLMGQQTASGGWGGGVSTEAPNTNSTGLVVQALADAGATGSAVSSTVIAGGAAYLRSAQASDADAGTAMGQDIGAIGYQPADLVAARTDGITAADAWIRSGTQASLGLSRASFWSLVTGAVPQHAAGGGTPTPTTPPTPTPTPTPTPRPTPAPVPTTPVATAPPAAQLPAALPPAARTTPRSTTRVPSSTPSTPSTPSTASTAATSASALPAGSATPAGRMGHFLAASLVGGDHVEVTSGTTRYVDYDATADTVLALRALGEQPASVARASAFLLRAPAVAAYAHGAPYEKASASYAAPLAKLALVAELLRRDGTAPAGTPAQISSLVASLEALQGADGTFEDTGTYADRTDTVERHAWATMALTALGAGPATDRATAALVERQCADGGFATNLVTTTCATGDAAATGWAVQALDTVRAPAGAASTDLRSAPSAGTTPAGWDEQRVSAVRRAAALLHGIPTTSGLVAGPTGTADLAVTAVVAAGRQAAGLDASDTARSLGGMLRADGGLAAPSAVRTTASDRALTLAAADGVAGRSWAATATSPLVTGLRVLDVTASDAARPAAASTSAGDAWWRGPWALLVGVVLVLALLGFTLGAVAPRLLARRRVSSTTSAPPTAAPPSSSPVRPVLQTREEPS